VTPLNHVTEQSGIVAQLVEFQPSGAVTTMDDYRDMKGLIYVLEGRLRLESGGMHEVLETGDCICVDSGAPLAWGAADKRRCRMLAVLAARHGES
jgi:quercetin dioxygenase-like cupin family protein